MIIASIESISQSGVAYFREDSSEREATLVAWDKVKSVTALKSDLWSVDLICLVFQLSNGDSIEFNEDDLNWDSLTSLLPEFLKETKKVDLWLSEVAFPAFEPCEQVIYSSDTPTS